MNHDPAKWPRRPTVLVVDDDPAQIRILHRILKPTTRVLMAGNGPDALACCAQHKPDLVLLDLTLPGMDGFAIIEALKSDEALSAIPVIFVTAGISEEAESMCLEAGGSDYITKPVNPRVLLARVGTHLTVKFLTDELTELATRDGLTGAYNRRTFDERLASDLDRAQRSGSPLSLALIDVDHFKSYNDTYGHQAGDEVLRVIVSTMRVVLNRPGDLVARYGGEEFACLLPDTPAAGAAVPLQRIIKGITDLAIPHVHSPTRPTVTVSAGLAASTESDGTSESLLALADARLYRAKELGRARLC